MELQRRSRSEAHTVVATLLGLHVTLHGPRMPASAPSNGLYVGVLQQLSLLEAEARERELRLRQEEVPRQALGASSLGFSLPAQSLTPPTFHCNSHLVFAAHCLQNQGFEAARCKRKPDFGTLGREDSEASERPQVCTEVAVWCPTLGGIGSCLGAARCQIDFLPLQRGTSLDKAAAEARLREYLDEAAAAEQKICEKLKLCLLPACTPSSHTSCDLLFGTCPCQAGAALAASGLGGPAKRIAYANSCPAEEAPAGVPHILPVVGA